MEYDTGPYYKVMFKIWPWKVKSQGHQVKKSNKN